MMTGYHSEDTAAESARLGAFDYIQKPISKDTIFSVINLAIQHKTMVDEKKKFQK
jgi:DNA-binding NtrC family response regulator